MPISGTSDEIEYIMISEINFEKLELLTKVDVIVEEQVYEDVPGFESLRKLFTKIASGLTLILYPT